MSYHKRKQQVVGIEERILDAVFQIHQMVKRGSIA
jgi:hypothetical protein